MRVCVFFETFEIFTYICEGRQLSNYLFPTAIASTVSCKFFKPTNNINMKEIFWPSFAKLVNGEIKEGKFDASDRVESVYNGWKISFDHFTLWSSKYSTRLTRVTVPFISTDNFRFEIYEKSIFSSIAKVFGLQDIKIGYEEFDKKFIVKSNDELKIKSLLWNSNVRSLIEKLKNFSLQTSDQKGIWEEKLQDNELELSIYFEGEIHDSEILMITRDVLMEILNFLSRTKSVKQKKAYS